MPHNDNNAANVRPHADASHGFHAEHVLLESDEAHEAPVDCERTIASRLELRNRVLRHETVLVAFEDGFMSVKESRRGHKRPEYVLDLRCVDHAPERHRHVATTILGIALLLTGCAAAAGLLASRAAVHDAVGWAALACAAAAPAAWWAFVRRTFESTAFRTRHGRATVLALVAHLGCMRAFRARSRELAELIEHARERDGRDGQQRLRSEMREHYRLAESGVIDASESAAAVRRTLAQFG